MSTARTPRRGEIWMVDFDPGVGAEIRKLRPAREQSVLSQSWMIFLLCAGVYASVNWRLDTNCGHAYTGNYE